MGTEGSWVLERKDRNDLQYEPGLISAPLTTPHVRLPATWRLSQGCSEN